ncbi:UDP-N-acetylmuramoyl-L-alanine--D-glutamate ligase [Vibrio sp. TH_r3]|uniref:UDP-N-acetylmuramoyl-L-alanine--D-glutamate ligase n=1 Tax=Vibrio sp. TH_r3 TaxID=3082084 RepID=UPI0029554250|nr:UDP-N-acetylmuramoyl-L-alanine--D-glutamate ligase [Vibrio sp. TH_r3]MDV7104507.1 UDP-N-acetylmuramoyl-L-alanine--D-glutamate ligase [Vibrio sp. TH_r3]
MDRWNDINNVVVVGLGVTGLSVVNYLIRLNKSLNIKVIDTREEPPGRRELDKSIPLHTGNWNSEWLLAADLVVVNPGIALATSEIQQVLQANIPVVGDIELFAWAVNAPVIAITGSNGKSTVTDLTGVLAEAAGIDVAIGGNIGVPALDLLIEPRDLYVLELSSFQLETTSSLSLIAAAFLNLSEDHMDRYPSMLSYKQAKLKIFDNAENIIVNHEDKETYPIELIPQQNLISFGLQSGQFRIMSIDGMEWLSNSGEPILPVTDLALVGQHNIANVLTVLALLSCVGINNQNILEALKSYTGLTHRCQVVVDNRGIRWVNDSKATNVASTLAALSGLDLQGTLHLFVGGVGKGADFSELAPVLAKLNVKLYCFGRDGDQFMSLHPSASRWERIDDIVQAIAPTLQSGDMVMLSPACASFDQYNNFMARGDAFTQLAKQNA